MNTAQPAHSNTFGIKIPHIWLRIAGAAILCGVLFLTALPSNSASAATVGNCTTVASYPRTSYGKIRWSGMAQCFAMYLEHGYTYTITVNAGDRSYAGSTNYYEPLGDSVLILFESKAPGVSVNDPYNSAFFNYVGMNDDYAAPAQLGSRMTYKVSGDPYMSTLFIARVSGFNQSVGTYSITVTRSVEVDLGACDNYFSCM